MSAWRDQCVADGEDEPRPISGARTTNLNVVTHKITGGQSDWNSVTTPLDQHLTLTIVDTTK